ncbi:AtzG-like protein [Halioxenophilus sp. WMMB6]|uniref:AtzG-like protein n=1 Tax=Halioxenophilus sp. WMMB6 TaxID=3073815 RepID=UPI00295E53CC|nr:AtzG-like protein [Halioxenophilus sp. WMMB6]
MSNPFDLDAYYELMKTLVDIPIQAEWEAVIKMHLATAAKMAAIIEAAPVDPNSLELASVFHPGGA